MKDLIWGNSKDRGLWDSLTGEGWHRDVLDM